MKKFLLLLTLVIVCSVNNPSTAQCLISDLKVRLINVNANTCEVTFDLSWTQEVNMGNKFAYIHMWTQSAYHTPASNWTNMYSGTSDYPRSADLQSVSGTIVIDDNSSDNPSIGNIYHPDPEFTLPQLTGLSVVKAHLNNTLVERMTVKNIKLTLPSCAGAITIYFDIWASQSSNGKNVHCAAQGKTLIINEVKPLGSISCALPRHFQVSIHNTGPVLDNVSYVVYIDYPPIAVINDADILIYTSDPISLAANSTYYSPSMGYLPYSNTSPSANMPLIVEVTVPDRPNTSFASLENGCGPLPVKLVSFDATQTNNKIVLYWQTASEYNNKGFEIQRMINGGDYKTIAFVPSMSVNGNSDVVLNYRYEDIDMLKGAGLLYYRLRQINADGTISFSDVRVVKNNAENFEILIYPNPATTITNIILPGDIGPVDIVLTDISGRNIKNWTGAINHLQLSNLRAGTYILKVFVKTTGTMQANKIIIQ